MEPSTPSKENFGEQECDMLFEMDLMGRITTVRFMNRELAQRLGYTEAELIGQNVTDFLVESQSIAGAAHFGELYSSEKAFRAVGRKLKLKNGQMIIAESYLMPMYDGAGKLIGHRGMEFFTLEAAG